MLEFWITAFGIEIGNLCRGVAKLVKAPDFDSGMRGFESFLPCQTIQGYR